MTIVQSINPITSKTAATIEGAGAGALLGAGIGYMTTSKPSEDIFVKNALELANKNLLRVRNTAVKILKKMNKNEPVSKKLLESIADNGYTTEELTNIENVKKLIVESSLDIGTVNNGKPLETALERLEKSTHPDKEIAASRIKAALEKVIKPAYEESMNELKEAYKAGTADETYKDILGYIKKKTAGKYAAIGAVALGVAGYFVSKYLNLYPKQKNI